jgi:hypothetical protein
VPDIAGVELTGGRLGVDGLAESSLGSVEPAGVVAGSRSDGVGSAGVDSTGAMGETSVPGAVGVALGVDSVPGVELSMGFE